LEEDVEVVVRPEGGGRGGGTAGMGAEGSRQRGRTRTVWRR
jgi:hypothetical protein